MANNFFYYGRRRNENRRYDVHRPRFKYVLRALNRGPVRIKFHPARDSSRGAIMKRYVFKRGNLESVMRCTRVGNVRGTNYEIVFPATVDNNAYRFSIISPANVCTDKWLCGFEGISIPNYQIEQHARWLWRSNSPIRNKQVAAIWKGGGEKSHRCGASSIKKRCVTPLPPIKSFVSYFKWILMRRRKSMKRTTRVLTSTIESLQNTLFRYSIRSWNWFMEAMIYNICRYLYVELWKTSPHKF